jgi:DNA-binding HxlR family transcriptional regulator
MLVTHRLSERGKKILLYLLSSDDNKASSYDLIRAIQKPKRIGVFLGERLLKTIHTLPENSFNRTLNNLKRHGFISSSLWRSKGYRAWSLTEEGQTKAENLREEYTALIDNWAPFVKSERSSTSV